MEFSKKLIILDYFIMVVMVFLSCGFPELSNIAIAWVAQLAISSGFYFWKAKNENRLKIPIEIIRSLNRDSDCEIDLTQIITSIIEKD